MEDEKEMAISERLSIFQQIIEYLEKFGESEVFLHNVDTNAKKMTITVILDDDGR